MASSLAQGEVYSGYYGAQLYPNGWTNIDYVDYYTYRNIRGPVWLRLDDVTPWYGNTFHHFRFDVHFIRQGQTGYWSSTRVGRTWGQGAGDWTYVGYWANWQTVRMRVQHAMAYNPNGTGYYMNQWCDFNLLIDWNPNIY